MERNKDKDEGIAADGESNPDGFPLNRAGMAEWAVLVESLLPAQTTKSGDS